MDRYAYRWAAHTRWATFAVGLGLVTLLGCGSSSPVADSADTPNAPSLSVTANPGGAGDGESPTDVVSRFLDEFRRGGSDSRANQLLTEKARTELARIGLTVEPIGTPDAQFVVTRAEPVPDEPNSMFVHSILSEPGRDGQMTKSQVVWAVERERIGWRISGFAMEIDPKAEPIIVDFENAELMAKLMGNSQQNADDGRAAAQTANGARSLSR